MALLEITEQHVRGVAEAIKYLRYGYPDLPYAQQCRGSNFRWGSGQATWPIAQRTLQSALRLDASALSRVVVMMPWRAGLAFAEAYQHRGIKRFYHVSSKRDEQTLVTMVDYECGTVGPGDIVIVADPMLATGNTTCDAIERLVAKGVLPSDIYLNAVVAAPEGIAKVLWSFPDVSIIVGARDERLSPHGMIEPGCGDYGDKFFHAMSRAEKFALAASFNLDPESELRLIARLCAA